MAKGVAGVIGGKVEAAVAAVDGGEQIADPIAVGEVDDMALGAAAGGFDRRHQVVEFFGRAAGGDNMVAGRRRPQAERAADAVDGADTEDQGEGTGHG